MKKINLNQIPWVERRSPKGDYHRFLRDTALAFRNPKTGPKLRGQPPFEVELVRLPPGAKNFPLHSHTSEWEFYLIVSGTATMRTGRQRVKVRAGDCILNPPGEPHHLINTGKLDLHYYVIANNSAVDLWHYPDSGKWGGTCFRNHFRLHPVSYYADEE